MITKSNCNVVKTWLRRCTQQSAVVNQRYRLTELSFLLLYYICMFFSSVMREKSSLATLRWSARSRRKIDLILVHSPAAPLVRCWSRHGRQTRWWTSSRWSIHLAAWWSSGVYRDLTAGDFESKGCTPTILPVHTHTEERKLEIYQHFWYDD